MSKYEKILQQILNGLSDNNINFKDLRFLLLNLEFHEKVKGSHHIFYKDGIEEILNIQPKGNKAKAYKVKQIRNIILRYKMVVK
jgi:hypothetical protein